LAQRDFVDHFTRIDSIGKKHIRNISKLLTKMALGNRRSITKRPAFKIQKELTFSRAKAQKMQTDVDEIAVPQGKGE